ncbi:hypothetical protein [Cereibacter sphaeroides]|nr:hypothetical protein [Cereibacter sphaeroides]
MSELDELVGTPPVETTHAEFVASAACLPTLDALPPGEADLLADLLAELGPTTPEDLVEAEALNREIASMTPAEVAENYGTDADVRNAAAGAWLEQHQAERLERFRKSGRNFYAEDKLKTTGQPVRPYRRDLKNLTPEERKAHRRAQKAKSKANRSPEQVERERAANKAHQQKRRGRERSATAAAERANLALF